MRKVIEENHRTVLELIDAALRDQLGTQLEQFLAEQGKPEPWIDAGEAARHLRCSKQRIYDLVAQAKKNGEGIPHEREGSRLAARQVGAISVWLGPSRPGRKRRST